jgi:hypothetical protein
VPPAHAWQPCLLQALFLAKNTPAGRCGSRRQSWRHWAARWSAGAVPG